MRLILQFLGIFIFVISLKCHSQDSYANESLLFSEHLIGETQYEEAIFVLKKELLNAPKLSISDSAKYLIGAAYFLQNIFDSAYSYYINVSENSLLFEKAIAFSIFCGMKTNKDGNNYSDHKSQLIKISNAYATTLFHDANKLEKAYIDLSIDSKELTNLNQLIKDLSQVKRYSPFLAASFSTLLPGAGKWYLGEKKQALSSFFQVALLGAISTESYVKTGPRNPLFLFFSALTTISYAGNIYGSAVKAKQKINDQYISIDEKAVLHLRNYLPQLF